MSRIPRFLQPVLGDIITSSRTRAARRGMHATLERLGGRSGRIEWYHDVGCPWSNLLALQLGELIKHFDISIRPYTVSETEAPYRPNRERYTSYAFSDSKRLARYHGMQEPITYPTRQQADHANAHLVAYEDEPESYLAAAQSFYHQLFCETSHTVPKKTSHIPYDNRQRLYRMGHYQAGMLRYHGEWYWGLDRLSFLEEVLRQEQRGNGSTLEAYPERVLPLHGDTLDCYFSFRSPYSYIALPRIYRIADRYGLNLRLKPILPMLDRGLEIPHNKRWYVIHDAAREAFRHNVVFGRIRDPLGEGVENAIAIFSTLDSDYQQQFAWSAMNGAWARGLNLAKRRDLDKIALEAGVESWQVDEALHNDSWFNQVEANGRELYELGLWGVPSFHLKNHAMWGQDRLHILEAGIAQTKNELTVE